MAVVGTLALHLTGSRRQQVLQGPKTMLDPVTPLPCPYQPWPADGRVETHHVELLLPGFTDHNERYRAIRRAGGLQPRIAHPRHLLAIPPQPIAVLLYVMPLDLPPIGQVEDIATLPFHEKCALVPRGHVAHELRIAEPAIGHDHRLGQLDATSVECRHAAIQHALYPVQFVAAWPSRTFGVRPPDGKVDGHHQFAISDHHDEQDAINTGEHAVFLPTPPGAQQAQLLAVLFEH